MRTRCTSSMEIVARRAVRGFRPAARYAREEPDAEQAHDERGAAVADERQRYAGDRPRRCRDADVHERLQDDRRRDAGREIETESVFGCGCDADAAICEREEEQEHRGRADKAELLTDDRVDEIRIRLRQVAELLTALPESNPEDTARSERVERLYDVVTGALRVVERMEKRGEAIAPVRAREDEGDDRRDRDDRLEDEMHRLRACGEHDDERRDDEQRSGAKIGLAQDEREREADREERRRAGFAERSSAVVAIREHPREKHDEREL